MATTETTRLTHENFPIGKKVVLNQKWSAPVAVIAHSDRGVYLSRDFGAGSETYYFTFDQIKSVDVCL